MGDVIAFQIALDFRSRGLGSRPRWVFTSCVPGQDTPLLWFPLPPPRGSIRWIFPSRGVQHSQLPNATETGISSGWMGHLAR